MAASAIGAFCYPEAGLDLEETLLGGQSFSWRKTGAGRYLGVAGPHAAEVWNEGGDLLLRPLGTPATAPDAARVQQAPEPPKPAEAQKEPKPPQAPGQEQQAFWCHYFALDEDYAAIQKTLCQNAALARCVACAPGLRVLRQPFFETLLAFILSANNNIPRIAGIAARLRQGWGDAITEGEHAYPRPEQLAGLAAEALAPLRAGYRAAYLIDAAQKVQSGAVSEEALRALPTDEARRLLCTIKGVGPKVADCVLLFGLGRSEAAPMDVWMKRALAEAFGGEMPACAEEKAGIAQQYIFAWARKNLPRGGKGAKGGAAQKAAKPPKIKKQTDG